MKRLIILSLFSCFPIMLQAADLPEVVNENEADNQQMCVSRAANDCVNTVCMNSPDMNCTDKCQSDAEDKCEEMAE